MNNSNTPQFNEAILEEQLHEALELVKEGKIDDISKAKHGYLPIHLACLRQNVPFAMVKTLVDAQPDSLKVRSFTKEMALPIHFAAGCGASLEVVQLLVNTFPDSIYAINVNGLLPLHSACWSASTSFEVISFLATQFPGGLQARTHNTEEIPLHAVAYKGASSDVIKLLVRLYPDGLLAVNSSGYTPRMIAENKGNDRIARLLREEEGKVQQRDFVDTKEIKTKFPGTTGRDRDILQNYPDTTWSDPLVQQEKVTSSSPENMNKRDPRSCHSTASKSHLGGMSVMVSSDNAQDSVGSSSSSLGNRKNSPQRASSNSRLDVMSFSTPERTGMDNFRTHKPISPFAGSTANVLRDGFAETQINSERKRESPSSFGETESLGTTNTGGRSYRSKRANSFSYELEQSEMFWGVQYESSKTRPSLIERVSRLEEKVFGKSKEGPLLKRHKDLFYYGCDGETFAEWIDQLEEIYMGKISKEGNAVTRIESLETLLFGARKAGDMRGRLHELDAVSRFD